MSLHRLDYLDGLRGLAALVVVFHHSMYGFYPSSYTRAVGDVHTGYQLEWWLHDTPLGIFINGGFAVVIFLLLSGYLTSIQFHRYGDDVQAFVASQFKRFFRFFALIFACNLIAYIAIVLNFKWNTAASAITHSWWWLGSQWQVQPSLLTVFSQSWGSLYRTYTIQEVLNSSVWTMPFFIIGPMFVYCVMLFTKTFKYRWVVYLLLCLPLFRTYYYVLILGMMVDDLNIYSWSIFRNRLVRILILLIGLYFANYPQTYTTAYLSSWYHWLPILSFTHTSSFYALIGGILIFICLLASPILQRIFTWSPFVTLGTYSFAIYLSHVIVINSLSSYVFVRSILILDYFPTFLLSIGISLPVIFLISWVLYHVVELPAQNFAKRVYIWLTASS